MLFDNQVIVSQVIELDVRGRPLFVNPVTYLEMSVVICEQDNLLEWLCALPASFAS